MNNNEPAESSQEALTKKVDKLRMARSVSGALTTVVLVGVAIAAGVAAAIASSYIFLWTSLIGAMLLLVMRAALALYSNSIARTLKTSPSQLREQTLAQAITRTFPRLGEAQELSGAQQLELAQSEMASRGSSWRWFALLGVGLLAICVSLIAIKSSRAPRPAPIAASISEQRVVQFKAQILVLRGDAEARNLGWELEVRRRGKELARLIGSVDERDLHPARRIILHEYRGWSLLMVANTFENTHVAAERESQADYAKQAIEDFNLALDSMNEIAQKFAAGAPDVAPVYKWMKGASEDLNRTHFLKAAALALLARIGEGSLGAVKAELTKIDRDYLKRYPTNHNPDLHWAEMQ